jgi:hypothetical protein
MLPSAIASSPFTFQPPMCAKYSTRIACIALCVWLGLIGLCNSNAPGANASLAEQTLCQFPSLVATCFLVPFLVPPRLRRLLSTDSVVGSLLRSSSLPIGASTRFLSISKTLNWPELRGRNITCEGIMKTPQLNTRALDLQTEVCCCTSQAISPHQHPPQAIAEWSQHRTLSFELFPIGQLKQTITYMAPCCSLSARRCVAFADHSVQGLCTVLSVSKPRFDINRPIGTVDIEKSNFQAMK